MLASYIVAVSRTVCATGLCETYFNPTKTPQSQFNSGLIYPFHTSHLLNQVETYTSHYWDIYIYKFFGYERLILNLIT